MADFEIAVNYVLKNEGGINDRIASKDPGGLTNHGISLRFLKQVEKENLKKYEIFDDEIDEDTIRNLSLDQAKKIYSGEFWIHAPFERIINQEHANYIFDMVINIGINPAIKCVQHSIWAVMRKWEFLKDDGIMGDKTLANLNQCGFLLMPALRAERANYYRNLAAQSEFHRDILHARYNRTYCA